MIKSPVRILGENAKVRALINDSTKWWNYELIREVFPKDEAKRICSMVISPLCQKDQIVWAGTKKGIFTIRNAYHMAKKISLAMKVGAQLKEERRGCGRHYRSSIAHE